MDCWYPITVPRYFFRKQKDGYFSKYTYGRMQVPCGRCPACRRRKQNEWAFRILEEVKYTRLTAFVTLTYSDEFLPYSALGIPTLVPDHMSTFCKNLRYDLSYPDPNNPEKVLSFRFFGCGEYGDQFERPHMHLLIFYNGPQDHRYLEKCISDRWTYGFIDYEEGITAGRAKYCAKYSMKQVGFDYQDAVPPFARMSRRPGIGKKFLDQLNTNLFKRLDQWCVHDYQGTPYPLPRYYKDFIYSSDERYQHSLLLEQLKNAKTDKSIREMEDYWKYKSDELLDYDYKFIRLLKKENYGFRYKRFKPHEQRKSQTSEELVTDEF